MEVNFGNNDGGSGQHVSSLAWKCWRNKSGGKDEFKQNILSDYIKLGPFSKGKDEGKWGNQRLLNKLRKVLRADLKK